MNFILSILSRRVTASVIVALVVSLVGAAAIGIRQHDKAVIARHAAAAAAARADSIGRVLVARERALHDTIAQLARTYRRDSTAWLTAAADWARVAHPRTVVRIDTVQGRIDTVHAVPLADPATLVRFGDAAVRSCSTLLGSCGARTSALERDTLVKAQRIAELQVPRVAHTCRDSKGSLAIAAVLGAAGGYIAGRNDIRIRLGGFSVP